MSPGLFVIAMELFHYHMKQAAKKGEIPYHSRCKRLCITHLCFADDPLAFTNGTDKGVYGICEVLKKFYYLTEIQINPTIMEIFYSNSVECIFYLNSTIVRI